MSVNYKQFLNRFALPCCLLWFAASAVASPLKVVASTTDIAALLYELGGESLGISVICQAGQDPHEVELLPAHVTAVREAALYFKIGAGLDVWADDLVKQVGRAGLRVVDCSAGIELIHAEHEHDEAQHVLGNPHYWLGPSSLRNMAYTICDGLASANVYSKSHYEANRDRFVHELDSAIVFWAAELAPCGSPSIISYHSTWDYFARDFGWTVAGTLEASPGSEPGPADIARLLETIQTKSIQMCLLEPFYQSTTADMVSRETGIQLVRLPSSVPDAGRAQATLRFYESLVQELVKNCK